MGTTKPHWAPYSNQTQSWYDWKTVESGIKPEYTQFSDAFPSNSNDLECINMGTTKPRCIKFHHNLRCIDVFVIFVFKTKSTFQRLYVPDAMRLKDEVFMDESEIN